MEFTPNVAGEMDLAATKQTVQTQARQLQNTADRISKDRNSRQKTLQARKSSAVKSIRDFTKDMVEKLHCMEEDSIKEVESVAGCCGDELQAELLCCGGVIADLAEVQQAVSKADTDKVKADTDKVTAFIKMKNAQRLLKVADKTLKGLKSKQTVDNENFSFQLNTDIDSSISKFNSIGSLVKTPSHPTQSSRTTQPPNPTQSSYPTQSPRPYKAVNKRDVSVKVKGDKETCSIWGVCQLPDGSVVVSDYNNKKLKKLDLTYKVTCHCSLPAGPRGVCHIDGDKVAVALNNKTIQFVSVGDGMVLTRSLSLSHGCTGVAHHQGRLYVTDCFYDIAAVHVYSMSGNKLDVFSKDQNGRDMFVYPCYIALSASGNTVYVADINKGLVTMDTQGHVLATFSSSDLEGAEGVCVADDGSVFVSGTFSHNVIQVGQEGRTKLADVVTSSAGIKYPQGICLDKRRSTLIVGVCENNCLAVFDLTQ